jgi:hypothetical protein
MLYAVTVVALGLRQEAGRIVVRVDEYQFLGFG